MSLIHLKDVNKTYQGAQPLHVLKGIDPVSYTHLTLPTKA